MEEAAADPLLAPATGPLAISIEQPKADRLRLLILSKLELQEQKFVMPLRLIEVEGDEVSFNPRRS